MVFNELIKLYPKQLNKMFYDFKKSMYSMEEFQSPVSDN